jgi:hypothetical protein
LCPNYLFLMNLLVSTGHTYWSGGEAAGWCLELDDLLQMYCLPCFFQVFSEHFSHFCRLLSCVIILLLLNSS